jgi:hypothetical protein
MERNGAAAYVSTGSASQRTSYVDDLKTRVHGCGRVRGRRSPNFLCCAEVNSTPALGMARASQDAPSPASRGYSYGRRQLLSSQSHKQP